MQELKAIQEAKPDVEIRVCRRAVVRTVVHQGDVYLHRVPDDHPRGKKLGTRQVAVGTSVGSRHVAEGKGVSVFAGQRLPSWVTEPAWCQPGAILGPVIVATEPFVLTHPEHAHHQCPAGVWQTTYQADFATQQRVAD